MNGNATFLFGVANGTAFYVLGTCLAVLAILVTAEGLRNADAFSSKLFVRGGLALFAILVVGTITFAVRYSRDEQADRRAELASEEAKQGGTELPGGGEVPSSDAGQASGTPAGQTPPSQTTPPSQGGGGQSAAKGPGGTVQLAADPTQIAYVQKSLSSKPGNVTIDFDNPSQLQHDVAVEQGGKELAKSDLISASKTSVSVDLAPGKYVFYCTVPGHREAGMQGTLTVK